MPNAIRVGAVSSEPPRGAGRGKVIAVTIVVFRFAVFAAAAWAIWKSPVPLNVKEKLHGSILTALSFVFTLQEFLFFQARNRLGEPLKSVATLPQNLLEMLARCQSLKAYLDRTWMWVLGTKISGLIAGPVLFARVLETIRVPFWRHDRSAEAMLAIFGWFCVLNAAFLTVKTFRTFRHVDRVMAQLEVEAREIAAQKEAAAALKAAPVDDWKEDPDLRGYKRIRRKP